VRRSGIPRRREFLLQTAAVLGSWAVPLSFRKLLAAPVRSVVAGGDCPAPDETTRLPLLRLLEGFRFVSFRWEMVVRQQPGTLHYFRHRRRLADARDLVWRAVGRQPSVSRRWHS
jgi:hypothetical protein